MPASRGAPSTRLPWQRASLTNAYLPDWSYSCWDWDFPPGRNGKRVNSSEHACMVQGRAAFLRKVLLLPRPQSTSAVVSLMWSYTLERMRRFVGTLRAHYHGGVLLLMSARPPPDIQDYLVAQRVTQVPIAPIGDIAVERFIDYARVCSVYQRCLAIDFGDVFFQGDPFIKASEAAGAPDLLLQLEELTIRECPHNRAWIMSGWGPQVVEQIGRWHVVNSGAIIGSPQGFEALGIHLPKARPRREHDNSTSLQTRFGTRKPRPLWGSWWDQPTLNYMAYVRNDETPLGKLDVAFQPRGQGVVNTIGVFRGALTLSILAGRPDLNFSKMLSHMSPEGLVLNDDGSPSAAVHQYDRFAPYHKTADPDLHFAALERASAG